MKKYTVDIFVTEERTANVEIEAENEESARSQVDEMIPYDDYEPEDHGGDVTGEIVGIKEEREMNEFKVKLQRIITYEADLILVSPKETLSYDEAWEHIEHNDLDDYGGANWDNIACCTPIKSVEPTQGHIKSYLEGDDITYGNDNLRSYYKKKLMVEPTIKRKRISKCAIPSNKLGEILYEGELEDEA